VLLGVYALTLPLHAAPGSTLAPAEAHRLLVAESLVSDGDVDLRDEYATHAWRRWYRGPLRPTAPLTGGRRVEPVGLGFAVLIAPAYAAGGPTAVRLELAALAALAFCLAAALARSLVPEPWATRAALVAGLSPPALGAATTVSPEGAGAAVLAGAALLALRVRREPQLSRTAAGAALVATLPWLAAKLVAPGVVVAAALARWLRRRQRGLTGFIALEVALMSAVLYLTVDDRLFGALTPNHVAPGGPTGAHGLEDYLARVPRLLGVWLDPHDGVLIWAPFLALAFGALVLLWRSRRERLAVTVEAQGDVEVSAAFLALVVLAGALVAAFLAPGLGGVGHPSGHARQLVPVLPELAALAAWGLRFAPRLGALLALATLAESVALLLIAS
jgi:hypothetical protein